MANALQQAWNAKVAGIPAPLAVGGAAAAAYLGYRVISRGRAQPQAGIRGQILPGTRVQVPSAFEQAPPPAQAPAQAAVPGALWQFGSGFPQNRKQWIWHFTGTNPPPGVQPRVAFPASTGNPVDSPGDFPGGGAFSWQWAPVPQGNDPNGTAWTDQSYAAALNAAGKGGPWYGRGGSIGSRSANLWWGGHPLLKQRIRYPQFVKAGGGPAQHQVEVHRVARQAGVHPAQVLAANPHFTGLIRVR